MDQYRQLGELIESISKTHSFKKEKLIFLNTSDVFEGKILVHDYMAVKEMKGQAKKSIKEGDILYSEIRPKNRRYAYVKNVQNVEDYVVSTKLMVIRKKVDYLDNDYLYHFLSNNETLSYLQRRAENRIGSFPQITFDIVKGINIWLPKLNEQQKIAKVLSDLDAKIELNNKINAELEAMAKLIYDYWFVQFEFPISKEQAKAMGKPELEGKPYKSSGGKMVENEELKREVPEGWEVKTLGEISEIKAGGDKPKIISQSRTDSCKVPIFSNGISNEGFYGFTDEAKIFNPSITVSARGTIGYSALRLKPFVPIIRLISITPKNSCHLLFLHHEVKRIEFENSGSVQQQLTVPQVSKLKILIPSESIIRQYDDLTSSSFFKIENNKIENQKLAELRDWLLPMLMNGQVRVGDV